MKTKWKVDPLWVGVFVVAAGTGITIEGVLRFSIQSLASEKIAKVLGVLDP
jgi:hypothetical protein